MTQIQNAFRNPIYQLFVSISPWILIFLAATFWDSLFNAVPDKASLTPLSGTVHRVGKSNATVNTDSGSIKVEYECLCDSAWSENQFPKGTPFTALGQPKGGGYYVWDFQVGEHNLISYETKAPKLQQRRNRALTYVVPALVLLTLLSIQLAWQSLNQRRIEREKKPLYPLLDLLDDQNQDDKARLEVLPEILKFETEDILGPLEFIAAQNTNSEFLLTRIGTELGKLWSELTIQEVENITLVQPAAKRAAMDVLEKQAPELNSELNSIGALRFSH